LVIFAWYHWLQAEALSAVMAARESI
jgi:hypothetical protein